MQALEILRGSGTTAVEKLDAFLDSLVVFNAENLDLLYGGHEPLCGADRLERFSHPAYDWRRSTVLGLLRTAVREGLTSSISLLRCLRRWTWTSTTTSTGSRGYPSRG